MQTPRRVTRSGADIYNQYAANPKIVISKIIRGNKGFDQFAKMTTDRDDPWASMFTEAQKKSSLFFTYTKKPSSKTHKVGIKLVVGSGENMMVMGHEQSVTPKTISPRRKSVSPRSRKSVSPKRRTRRAPGPIVAEGPYIRGF